MTLDLLCRQTRHILSIYTRCAVPGIIPVRGIKNGFRPILVPANKKVTVGYISIGGFHIYHNIKCSLIHSLISSIRIFNKQVGDIRLKNKGHILPRGEFKVCLADGLSVHSNEPASINSQDPVNTE